MPNELGWTATCQVSRISDTVALVRVGVANFPVNLAVNQFSIQRVPVDGSDVTRVLHWERMPSMGEFPLSYIDNGDCFVPGGGGAMENIPIDPTKDYTYIMYVQSQPVVYEEYAQAILSAVGTSGIAGTATKRKKR